MEIIKSIMLTRRADHFIRFSCDLFITSRRAAPATGRNISVLSIANPDVFVITCSIYPLKSIMTTMAKSPMAIIAA